MPEVFCELTVTTPVPVVVTGLIVLDIVVPPVRVVKLRLASTPVPLLEPRRIVEFAADPAEVNASVPFLTNVSPLYVLADERGTVPPVPAVPLVPMTIWPLPVLFPIIPVMKILPPEPVKAND